MAGFDVVGQAAQVRFRIGLLGQHAAVDEVLSGRQNLVLFGRLHHLGARPAGRRADELLERFGLADTGAKPVKQYSGGMRRRLDLAASLILAPPVLFLDEPTTGLDPRGRNEVWEAVRSLVAGGTTVLLTTQYLDEADQLADRISVIDHGRVIAEGTPDELKSELGGDRIDVVAHRADQLAAVAAAVGAQSGAEPEVDPDTRRVSAPVRDRVAALTGVARALDGTGVAVEDIALRRPTLDEVFLHLTGHPTRAPEQRRAGGAGMTVPTTTSGALAPPAMPRTPLERLRWGLADAWTVTGRDLAHWARQPATLVVNLLFMVMVVLLFGYLFGGAIAVPGGGSYREFLLPGMFAMSMMFGVEATTIAVTTDTARGVTDRFRAMPMARSAVVAGRGAADMLNSALGLAVLLACGLLVGWGWHNGAADALAAVGLLLLLRFAFVWVGIYLGLLIKNPEAVAAVQILVWPLGFVSSAIAPTATMPAWLGTLAEWNPLSATASAARELFGNPGWGGDSWVAQHAVLMAVVWPLLLVAVFFPLAVHRWQRLSR